MAKKQQKKARKIKLAHRGLGNYKVIDLATDEVIGSVMASDHKRQWSITNYKTGVTTVIPYRGETYLLPQMSYLTSCFNEYRNRERA